MLRLLAAVLILIPVQDGKKGWSLKKGAELKYRIDYHTPGLATDTGTTRTWDITLKVTRVDRRGATLDVTFDRIAVTYTTGAGVHDWDSAKAKGAPGSEFQFAGALFWKKSISFQITKKGKITRVTGVKKIVDALGKASAERLRRLWNDETVRVLLQTAFVRTPGTYDSKLVNEALMPEEPHLLGGRLSVAKDGSVKGGYLWQKGMKFTAAGSTKWDMGALTFTRIEIRHDNDIVQRHQLMRLYP